MCWCTRFSESGDWVKLSAGWTEFWPVRNLCRLTTTETECCSLKSFVGSLLRYVNVLCWGCRWVCAWVRACMCVYSYVCMRVFAMTQSASTGGPLADLWRCCWDVLPVCGRWWRHRQSWIGDHDYGKGSPFQSPALANPQKGHTPLFLINENWMVANSYLSSALLRAQIAFPATHSTKRIVTSGVVPCED